MKRRISVYLIIGMMLLLLASCVMQTQPEPVKEITLCAPQNAFIEDFETNDYKLWLEQKTGLKIKMNWLPEKEAEELVRTALLTGQNLPDAYVGFDSYSIFSYENLQELGQQGVIFPLDAMIEQYGENTKAVWEELAEYDVKEQMTSADGHIYFMPGFSYSTITRYRQIMWINKGWLDALDLPVPTTTEEFADTLRAFKTLDPNGNGENDEIPFAGTQDYMGKQGYDYLFNSFIYNNEKNAWLLLENGMLDFAPIRPQWREALIYINALYEEGLFSPLSFMQNDSQMKQMATDANDILGAFTSPGITYTVQQNSPELLSRYVGIAPLKGPDGVQLATVSIPLPKANGIILSAGKYPEEVFKLFDLMLSEEACLMGRYGKRGVDWDFADEGAVSIYGTPATIKIINQLWNTSQNKHLKQIGPYISRPKYSGGVTWDDTLTDGEYMNAQAAMLYTPYEPEEFVGTIIYSPEAKRSIQNIRTQIERYTEQSIEDFVTGKRDIHNDDTWDRYVVKFEELGLDAFLRVSQTAYDDMKE